jgi:hypothetical protein
MDLKAPQKISELFPWRRFWKDVTTSGRNHFYVAEYLCYCDVWEITIDADDNNQYLIQNWDEKSELVTLTNSFVAFLNRFLDGRVYEKDGLYEWKEEMKNEQ